MTHAFHIASINPSPKRDAGLCVCERRDALTRMRNHFGTTTID